MTRVFVANRQSGVRSAFRLLLQDLQMDVVGEAADWQTLLTQVAGASLDLVLVEWAMIPTAAGATLADLRRACPPAIVIVLMSHLNAHEQAAFSAGADSFISLSEPPDRVAQRLHLAAVRSP